MIVFVVLLLVPVLIQHITIKGHRIPYEKKNQKAMAFFFFFLTVLAMLRHESIGNDTGNYKRFFEAFSNMSWVQVGKEPLEFGFSYYNKIVSLITKEPQVFLAITAIIISAMIYYTYKRLCVDTSLTVVLFSTMSTFVMMFSGIRQMLAVGIGCIAYEFTRNKKLVPFIIAVGLAMAFHTSAFMLVFMYPLYHARITKKWLYAVVPILAVVFAFNKPIFMGLSVIIEKYTKYEGVVASTSAYTMLILFTIFAAFAFLIPDESRLDKETIGLRNFMLFSLVLQMFAPLHTLAMRLNYYYIIFIPLLLPKIIEYRSERWKQVAMMGRHVMVIFFLLYFFLIKINSDGNLNVFLYHFFWENV